MPDLVHLQRAGGIAILEISNPPSNVVTAAVRAGLFDALAETLEDADVSVILLTAAGRDFCAGMDLATDPTARPLASLCDRIERAGKPVVAALQGQVVAAGAALALAAHYRVAHAGAKLAFPDIRIGLVPEGGTTQRLPRLAGADPALDLLLGGQPMALATPPLRALRDAVVAEDLQGAAMRFCEALQIAGAGPRPSRDARAGLRDPMGFQTAIATRRKRLGDHPEQARHAIVDCVEAAQLLPFEAGLAREADALADLASGAQAQALRHLFLAERRLAAGAAQEAAQLPRDTRIAVLGGGPLATQIVIRALEHGLAVNWGMRDPKRLRAGIQEVTEALTARKASGTVSEVALRNMLDRLALGESHKMAQGVQAAIIAARGQGAVPLPEDAVRLKAFPDPVVHVDLRFALPLGKSALVEVLVGPKAAEAEVRRARALVRRMGKLPLGVATDGPGVVECMMQTLRRAADALVDLGESPFDIDTALRGLGWSHPPFEARDMHGLGESAQEMRAPGARNWSAVLVQAGRQGRETGRGFYRHQQFGLQADPAVTKLIDDMRPPATRPRSAARITELLFAALANEGVRILARRMVARPYEIDIALHLGGAFPRWLGGPMHAADQAGLFHVKRVLEGVDHPDREIWQPHAIWGELVKNGKRFADLNG